MEGYLPAGGMTTGIVAGKDMNGTTSEYLTSKFKRTGATGKRPIIGRSSNPGASKVWNIERDHIRRPERSHQNLRQNRNPGRSSSNRNIDRDIPNAGGKKSRTESRIESRIENRIVTRMA